MSLGRKTKMDDNTVLQIIGRLYLEGYKSSSIIQQLQSTLQEKDQLISDLEEKNADGLQSPE